MKSLWPRCLRPDTVIESIRELDTTLLRVAGVRAILFDMDNTLERGRPRRFQPSTHKFLQGLKREGFAVGIISNRRLLREAQMKGLRIDGVPTIFHAGKPRRRAFLQILEELDVAAQDAIYIGDRRLTDVLGARRAGLKAFLVRRAL